MLELININFRRDNKDTILVVCGCTAENHREELNDLDSEKVVSIARKKASQIKDKAEELLSLFGELDTI